MKKQMKTMVNGLIALGLLFLCVIASLFVLAAIPSEPTEVHATPTPTPSPTPTLSVKDKIGHTVQNTGQPLYSNLKSIAYSDGKAIVTYYIPADEIWDHETVRNQIKINSFYVEQSVWQKVKQD